VLCQAFLTLFAMTPLPRTTLTSDHAATTMSPEYNSNNNNMVVVINKNSNNNNNKQKKKQTQDNDERFPSAACSNPLLLEGKRTCAYHTPPSTSDDNGDDYYSDNDTVFGEILRGQAPALVLAETNHLLAFQDIHPRAPLHALIIPKRFVQDISTLTPDDVPLLQDMHAMAIQLLQHYHPNALSQQDDYILCFHVPPFTSVSHLHLHVLAPASQMKFYYKKIKYTSETRWCTSYDRVLTRLQQGQSSSPYFALPARTYTS
jgi:diadenosine tetraphosphate (Ap4A) HIT family hydrolase